MEREKLHKLLAAAGLGSRRTIEKWIADGRVQVDGETAGVGQRADRQSEIRVDGKRVELVSRTAPRVLIYHKPLGEICTRSDPGGRPTVFDRLPAMRGGRWVAVGRLDINTTGLLVFTNDGALAAAMMHPSSGFEREYVARVFGAPTRAQLRQLASGVELDGTVARFNTVERLGGSGRNRRYRVTVSEGRYREVRRLWQTVGCRVNQLKRVRFGPLELPADLPPGAYRELDSAAVDALRARLVADGGCP